MDNYVGERMTDEQFKNWLAFVNDSALEDAAYEGLVSGRAGIEQLKLALQAHSNELSERGKELTHLKIQMQGASVEIERKDRLINQLCNALSMYHNTGLSDCDESCEYLKLIQRAREEALQGATPPF
jgi:hypothetical protein